MHLQSHNEMKPGKPIPVILDTDIGSDVDDTWAVAHLLRCPELDLKLITTAAGDTRYRAMLAAKFLEVTNRTDVPIGIGHFGGEMPEAKRYQGPWVAGYDLARYPGVVHEDGIAALIDTVMNSPEPVTLIAIGPGMNIRRALEAEPRIAGRCRFVGMYGSVREGYGAGTPPMPEANVRSDVGSFRAILAADWLDLLLTPLDTCGHAILDGAEYALVRDSDDVACRAIMENYRIWVKRAPWVKEDHSAIRSSMLFDCVAVWLAYDEQWVAIESLNLSVTDEGMTIEDPAGQPVRVAMRWRDLPAFKRHLSRRLVGE